MLASHSNKRARARHLRDVHECIMYYTHVHMHTRPYCLTIRTRRIICEHALWNCALVIGALMMYAISTRRAKRMHSVLRQNPGHSGKSITTNAVRRCCCCITNQSVALCDVSAHYLPVFFVSSVVSVGSDGKILMRIPTPGDAPHASVFFDSFLLLLRNAVL